MLGDSSRSAGSYIRNELDYFQSGILMVISSPLINFKHIKTNLFFMILD